MMDPRVPSLPTTKDSTIRPSPNPTRRPNPIPSRRPNPIRSSRRANPNRHASRCANHYSSRHASRCRASPIRSTIRYASR